jgi:copper resistance protein B
MKPARRSILAVAMCALLHTSPLMAADSEQDERAPFGMPMHDDMSLFHLLMEQLEYGVGDDGLFRWDGQAWYGNDSRKLWLKSEGEISNGEFEHGRHEVLYDRPISTFFDLQAGLRADIDDNPGRSWFAFGVQGLAPNFFHVSATAYAGSSGHFAGNAEASFDLLLTQRLILQPKAELDLYTKSDPARGIGSGFSSFEGGVRLRYEITRKFAPYIGVNYEQKFGGTKRFAIANGEDPDSLRFVFGVRAWI